MPYMVRGIWWRATLINPEGSFVVQVCNFIEVRTPFYSDLDCSVKILFFLAFC